MPLPGTNAAQGIAEAGGGQPGAPLPCYAVADSLEATIEALCSTWPQTHATDREGGALASYLLDRLEFWRTFAKVRQVWFQHTAGPGAAPAGEEAP